MRFLGRMDELPHWGAERCAGCHGKNRGEQGHGAVRGAELWWTGGDR
jgi:mono/diheme cytochrome c family protein